MDRVLLKSNAKQQLGGSPFGSMWINAVLVYLVYSLVISAASATVVGALLLMGPLSYGLNKIFLKVVYGSNNINVGDLFDGFKDDFQGTMLLGLMMEIFVFLWSLLFIIPGIIKSLGYSMAYFIKVDHPEYDWKQCLQASESMMQGHKGEYFVLQLSFIGWIIVGALACGLGIYWVGPYMQLTCANYYAYRCAQAAPANPNPAF